ncbi:glycerate kinase [Neisseria sp. HSC-16F19]|nr:glycerate kinase [Neisseria sp. HSC-16F19]MCP2041592.1 glycerate kinase [Neisseria sp. HSC-16F19]
MKIIIAPDSFKESLSAADAAQAIRRGWAEIRPEAEYVCLPMADGGEGTADALVAALNGTWVDADVHDPLGRPHRTRYGLLPDGTAVMEMAAASGLHLVAPHERDPRLTSSYGTGEMMAHALARGARRLILGIGGSATNDGGAGMAQALGLRLLDEHGADLPPGGAALARLHRVDAAAFQAAAVPVIVACDVTNPLTGPEGASAVFGPQKGADAATVAELDAALGRFADVLSAHGYTDGRHLPGSGAAGGLGFGLRTLLNADLQPGIDMVMDAAGLHQHLAGADLLITGEGRMDGQTACGKVPLGVLRAAQAQGVPVIALCGSLGADAHTLMPLGFSAVLPTLAAPAPLAEIFAAAADNLQRSARQAAALWQLGFQAAAKAEK